MIKINNNTIEIQCGDSDIKTRVGAAVNPDTNELFGVIGFIEPIENEQTEMDDCLSDDYMKYPFEELGCMITFSTVEEIDSLINTLEDARSLFISKDIKRMRKGDNK